MKKKNDFVGCLEANPVAASCHDRLGTANPHKPYSLLPFEPAAFVPQQRDLCPLPYNQTLQAELVSPTFPPAALYA